MRSLRKPCVFAVKFSFLTAKAQGNAQSRKGNVPFLPAYSIILPMQRSIIGLFKKEYWQAGRAKGLVAVVFLCFFWQAMYFLIGLYQGNLPSPEFYLAVAIGVAVIYAWGMASTVYVLEHEKNTFPFLRSLPVSPLTVALGKVGWILCTTILILIGNLLLCAGWFLLLGFPAWENPESAKEILLGFAPALAEALVWGILWSTRCRNTALACIGSAACVFLVFLSMLFIADSFGIRGGTRGGTDLLFIILPFRLAVILIAGTFAVRSALRWFDFSIKDTRKVLIPRNFVFARYPQRVQTPFLALIHQHIRHASLVYPLGIACFILWSLGCLLLSFLFSSLILFKSEHTWWLMLGAGLLCAVMLIFWGNIFGHDQKNNSYQFLTRLGVHEGKVWWSRMLPATILYIPVLLCWLVYLFVCEDFTFYAPIAFTVWLTILAAGAYCSISFPQQMVGIVQTFSFSMAFTVGWMYMFLSVFGCSPLWTTVPVVFALLVVSRLRARYWLRETLTWRKKLITRLLVFGVMLAVLVAFPFVRIYSVPYVSWEQMEYDLAGTPANNQHNAGTPSPPALYKERLLQHYDEQRHLARSFFAGEVVVFNGFILDEAKQEEMKGLVSMISRLRYMPWEEARRERILRLQIFASLVESGILSDERSVSYRDFCAKLNEPYAGYDNFIWGDSVLDSMHAERWYRYTLSDAVGAVRQWYEEHGSFPESLDNLAGIPAPLAHPFTGEPVQYFVNSPPPPNVHADKIAVSNFSGEISSFQRAEQIAVFLRSVGTYLMLGDYVYLLVEVPE